MADQLGPSGESGDVTWQEGSEPKGGPLLAAGTSVGRYTVLELLGRGGMGAVYKAYDPELDRSIALKVLRPQSSGSESTLQAHGRVMREAQALAQLSHPNVVAVHDVGKFEGAVYIAMELVEGKTVRDWLQAGRPSRREVLEVFRQAGEGLLAAHQAGLVHRDFKPANVILGLDGRVRVADFGLVRSLSAPPPQELEPVVSADALRAREISLESGKYLSASLTLSGRFLGTPHYMSPEQYLGKAIDARTDQYSFSVCLFEALFGVRPFEGRELRELMENVLAGRRAEPPDGALVPLWLQGILDKGLAREAAERYPSMRELLDALASDPEEAAQRAREARRRSFKHVGFGAALATGVVLTALFLTREKALCRGGENLLMPVWNEEASLKVRAAFVATGRSYAADTFERVRSTLDRWALDWVSMHREACEATHVRGEQSEQVLDLRMECLRRKLSSLKAMWEVLGEKPDVAVMDKAIEATSELGGVAFCADVAALSQAVPPPESPEARKTLEELRGRLEEVRVRDKLGRYEEAGVMLGEVRPRIEALGYRPLVGELRLQECQHLTSLGKYAEAEVAGREAFQTGLKMRDWDLLLRAAQELAFVVGVRMDRHPEGLLYLETAIGLSADLGDDREAKTNLQLGSVLFRQGKYAEAEVAYRRALEIKEASLGPDHISAVVLINNLGLIHKAQGHFDEAEREFRRALSLSERALGQDHPDVATLKNNLGNVYLNQGRLEEAEGEFREALSRLMKSLGPEHSITATARNNLALALREQGKLREAEDELRSALAIREKVLGPRHPDVAKSRTNLGEALRRSGKLEEAEAEYRLALDVGQAALRPDHPIVADALLGLGKVLIQQKRSSEALPFLERARNICEKARVAPDQLAEATFWYARALWTRPQDRSRAKALAGEARTLLSSSGKQYEARLREIELWLDEH